jgi:putative hydrolase of the HAD superfamily
MTGFFNIVIFYRADFTTKNATDMIDWEAIDTILLDMDGTLLDLNFDNHFWKEFVPLKYAQKHQLSTASAKKQLEPRFKAMEGKLEWYCLDYWSEELQLDIAGLKAEISHLIAVLPHVTEFLEKFQNSRQRVLLITNAHRNSLDLKMEKTCLNAFFDEIISSHDLGFPKENIDFWHKLYQYYPFDKQKTLFVDDSLSVLNAAKHYGVAHLVLVSKPDSKQGVNKSGDYVSIKDFRELMVDV